MSAEEKCKSPKCKHKANTRGLCRNCYCVASRMIQSGKTTWEKLEKAGKCCPKIPGGRKLGETALWLMS